MKIIIGFIIMVGCTVAANICMKLGAMAPAEQRFLGLVHWKTVIGLGSFGLAGIIYAWILSYIPLNVAHRSWRRSSSP